MYLVLDWEPPHATEHVLQVDQDESWQSSSEGPWHGAVSSNGGHPVPPQLGCICTVRLLCRVPDCPHSTALQADQEDQRVTRQSTGEFPWHGTVSSNEGHPLPPQLGWICTVRLLCRVPQCPHCIALQADQDDQ